MTVITADPWPFQLCRGAMSDINFAPKDIQEAFVKSVEIQVTKAALAVKDPKKHGWDIAMHLQKAQMELALLVSRNRGALHAAS